MDSSSLQQPDACLAAVALAGEIMELGIPQRFAGSRPLQGQGLLLLLSVLQSQPCRSPQSLNLHMAGRLLF